MPNLATVSFCFQVVVDDDDGDDGRPEARDAMKEVDRKRKENKKKQCQFVTEHTNR